MSPRVQQLPAWIIGETQMHHSVRTRLSVVVRYAGALTVASRRQRRRREQQRRPAVVQARGDQLAPLVYTREQAAQLIGVSLATLDRRVVPTVATVKTEWGARLIPAVELERFLAERR